jgi:hypothetical protein
MSEATFDAQLFNVEEAGRLLGGISPWTLRKHIAVGNVKVTRIGRRVFLATEEIEHIRREGLPSLGPLHYLRSAKGEATPRTHQEADTSDTLGTGEPGEPGKVILVEAGTSHSCPSPTVNFSRDKEREFK